MEGSSYAARGTELIEKLKLHLLEALRAHPQGATGVTVTDLQQFSGIRIIGKTGTEVWLLGFYTLLIELLDHPEFCSEVVSRKTRDWSPDTRVWIASPGTAVDAKRLS